jgi:hypothetical protein
MATIGLLCGSKERGRTGPPSGRVSTVRVCGPKGERDVRRTVTTGGSFGMAVDSRYIIRGGAARAEPWIVKAFSFR